MKKKLLCLLSAALLLISFSGCGLVDSILEEEPSGVVIDTQTIYGASFTNQDVSDAKLIMINFWEPWCGPCVGELPELARLYDNYKDEGLVILGVYSTFDMEQDALSIISDAGIKYPVIRSTADLEVYCSDYVPTTVFFDSEGNLLSAEPIIGANTYVAWESIVRGYLY